MSDEKYDRWKDMSRRDMKSKLKNNIEKRRVVFQEAVNRGVVALQQYIKKIDFHGGSSIATDDILPIVIVPLCVDKCYGNDAYNAMCALLDQWPGVNIPQCKNKPSRFKEYWRISDNWWNRQKGKWFGDLFFFKLLSNVLLPYCGATMSEKKSKSPSIYKLGHDLLFFFALYDIIHSEISFEKARPNPLIFDLAFQKSSDLNKYFTSIGNDHGLPWPINHKTKNKYLRQSVRDWALELKNKKCTILTHLRDNRDICNNAQAQLNVMPSIPPYRVINNNHNNHNDFEDDLNTHNNDPYDTPPPSFNNSQIPTQTTHIISKHAQIQSNRNYRRLKQQRQYTQSDTRHSRENSTSQTPSTSNTSFASQTINPRPPIGLPRPSAPPRRRSRVYSMHHGHGHGHQPPMMPLPTVPYNGHAPAQKMPPLPAPYNYGQHLHQSIAMMPFMNYHNRPFPHQHHNWDSQSSNPSIRSNVCLSHLGSTDGSTFPIDSTPNTIGTVEIDVFSSTSQPCTNPLNTPVPVNVVGHNDDNAMNAEANGVIEQISEVIDMQDMNNEHYYDSALKYEDTGPGHMFDNAFGAHPAAGSTSVNVGGSNNNMVFDDGNFPQNLNIDEIMHNINCSNMNSNNNNNSQPNMNHSMTPPAANSASNSYVMYPTNSNSNSNMNTFGLGYNNSNSLNGVISGSPPDRLNLLLGTPRLSDDELINGRVSNSNSEMNPTQMSMSNTFVGNVSSGNEL